MTTFTASEVVAKLRERFASGNDVPVPDVRLTRAEFDVIADLLEAQEKAVPVVWVSPDDLANPYFVGIGAAKAGHQDLGRHYTQPLYTHPAPSDAEKRDTMTPHELAKRIERGEKWKLADEPTPCQSRDAERLAEALRDILEIGKRNMENHKYDGFFNAAREALADHSAQAQPPAASVQGGYVLVQCEPSDAMLRAAESLLKQCGVVSISRNMLRAAFQSMLAAQENHNG